MKTERKLAHLMPSRKGVHLTATATPFFIPQTYVNHMIKPAHFRAHDSSVNYLDHSLSPVAFQVTRTLEQCQWRSQVNHCRVS